MRPLRLLTCLMSTSSSATNGNTAAAAAASKPSPWPALQVPPDAKINYDQNNNDNKIIRSVESSFNYCDDSVTKMYTRRDLQGSDDTIHGSKWSTVTKNVHNARLTNPVLDTRGFQLVNSPVIHGENKIDFRNSQQVIDEYYPQCISLVKQQTGAAIVHCFDHNVRVSGSQGKTEGDTTLQQPLGVVHNDYTHVSAPRRLEQLGQPPKANDSMKNELGDKPLLDPNIVQDVLDGKRRFVFCNVWRNISPQKPVLQFPLACVDATTQSLDEMLTFQIIYADRIGENYFSKMVPKHKWNYFPEMRHDEALLLKQWDSHGNLALKKEPDNDQNNMEEFKSTFSLHSAFQDPSSPKDAPPRESIEVRCVLIWDKEE